MMRDRTVVPDPMRFGRFRSACASTPHHLATDAAVEVLRSGGNAVDAAVAANLVLGVVTPYRCGFGGDLVALVDQGKLQGYLGIGAAPEAASAEAVAVAGQTVSMPTDGALTVTVPGAPQGWFDLLDRYGTRGLDDLAEPARRLAEDGFVLSAAGARLLHAAAARHADRPGWRAVYGEAASGRRLYQPGLARTIAALASEGPDGYYGGAIAADFAAAVTAEGGLLGAADLADHAGRWVEPVGGRFRGLEVVGLGPPTQGAAGLLALMIYERLAPTPAGSVDRHHHLIEATKLALGDRDELGADEPAASAHAGRITTADWAERRAAEVDPRWARSPAAVAPAGPGTACVLVADGDGGTANLVQSNLGGFGSGITVPGWGINLHNRGAAFALDASSPRCIGPRRRPLHTLAPVMVRREGRTRLLAAASGGDGQIQTTLATLTALVDDAAAVDQVLATPRWLVRPGGRTVAVEDAFPREIAAGLGERGHRVETGGWGELRFGCGQLIAAGDGPGGMPGHLTGAADPRSEGSVGGLP